MCFCGMAEDAPRPGATGSATSPMGRKKVGEPFDRLHLGGRSGDMNAITTTFAIGGRW
jgi:hypothetical protein